MYRIDRAKKQQVPVTNYGITIAHLTGILDHVAIAGMMIPIPKNNRYYKYIKDCCTVRLLYGSLLLYYRKLILLILQAGFLFINNCFAIWMNFAKFHEDIDKQPMLVYTNLQLEKVNHTQSIINARLSGKG